ncbi:MAG: hypothetical protein SGI88_05180 [Candidatus Hydrogenedentes bacterium]|nr:hypothetical protein [Candidatus Hydrogenedentota bacterium]
MPVRYIHSRSALALFAVAIAALHLVVPVGTHGRVLCFGDDGHVALVTAAEDECCDHASDVAGGVSISRLPGSGKTGECVDCIDVPLPSSEEREPARKSPGDASKIVLPVYASAIMTLVTPIGVLLPAQSRIPICYASLRSVTLLI